MTPKSNIRAAVAALIAVATVLVLPSIGQDAKPVPLGVSLTPQSELWIEGGSTLHDWESRTKESQITLVGAAGTSVPADLPAFVTLVREAKVTGLELSIPVTTMKSGKDGLDKKMYQTLKTDDFPTIDYRLTRYQFTGESANDDTMKVRAIGTITVSGVTKPDTLNARLYANDTGLWLEGQHAMRMTDFEIKPPKMMFGTLRTHDDFTVFYKLLLVPGGAAAEMQQDS